MKMSDEIFGNFQVELGHSYKNIEHHKLVIIINNHSDRIPEEITCISWKNQDGKIKVDLSNEWSLRYLEYTI